MLDYLSLVPGEITQREFRDESGEVMRALNAGETVIVTCNGVPVGELAPFPKRHFAEKARVLREFAGAPWIDGRKFRESLDALVS